MADAFTSTIIIELTAITQKHSSHQMQLRQPCKLKLERVTFLQATPNIFLSGPLSIETNALLDYESKTTLLGKGIAKRSNLDIITLNSHKCLVKVK